MIAKVVKIETNLQLIEDLINEMLYDNMKLKSIREFVDFKILYFEPIPVSSR
jgi:hypothetical protein